MDTNRLRMAIELRCNVAGRLASPTFDHHPSMHFPISWGVMALCQFPYGAFFLLILCCSRFHVLRHSSAPSSMLLSTHILNAALVEIETVN
jgi:hypothetical protein